LVLTGAAGKWLALPPTGRAGVGEVGAEAAEATAGVKGAGEAVVPRVLAGFADGEAAFDLREPGDHGFRGGLGVGVRLGRRLGDCPFAGRRYFTRGDRLGGMKARSDGDAGGGKPNPLHRLYRMDGPTLDRLSTPVALRATRAGFVFRNRIVHADMDNLIHVRDLAGDFDIELPGSFIYRVAYRADQPNMLLISGQWQTEDDAFTLEYDLTSGEQSMIECDGYPAYKCTILGDQMLYAQRIGEQFEHRRVTAAKSIARRSVASAVRRQAGQVQPIATQPMGNCGCRGRSAPDAPLVTRASCIECVEKHLGAAYVLLTETRDGYAYRLRAIGHLHEAEDESQEWPELHAAIRAARKAYQIDGTMPDWETLAKTSKAVRTSIR